MSVCFLKRCLTILDWITDRQMVFNKFVSASDSRTNCASWVAGMVEGCLTAAEFVCFPTFIYFMFFSLVK